MVVLYVCIDQKYKLTHICGIIPRTPFTSRFTLNFDSNRTESRVSCIRISKVLSFVCSFECMEYSGFGQKLTIENDWKKTTNSKRNSPGKKPQHMNSFRNLNSQSSFLERGEKLKTMNRRAKTKFRQVFQEILGRKFQNLFNFFNHSSGSLETPVYCGLSNWNC